MGMLSHAVHPGHLVLIKTHNQIEAKTRKTFDVLIQRRWVTEITPPNVIKTDDDDPWEEYHDDDEDPRLLPDVEDVVDATGKLLCQQPEYDKVINSEVLLQQGESLQSAKVAQRSIGPNGTTAGKYYYNPALNSIIYNVEFPDGTVKEYSANVIAQNMLSQVDSDGFTMTMMEGGIDHKMDNATAVPKSDKYIATRRGQRRLRKTTSGWKLLIKWKDGSESWIHLKDLKESHPVEVDEYAKARGIADEDEFSWWVPYHEVLPRGTLHQS